MLEKIEERIVAGAFSPPEVAELVGELKVGEKKIVGLLEHLAREKRVVKKISHEFYFRRKASCPSRRRDESEFRRQGDNRSDFRQLSERLESTPSPFVKLL